MNSGTPTQRPLAEIIAELRAEEARAAAERERTRKVDAAYEATLREADALLQPREQSATGTALWCSSYPHQEKHLKGFRCFQEGRTKDGLH